MRPLYLIVSITIVALVGGGLWFGVVRSPSQQPSGFFDTKPDYDTSGGQPMRPRWKD